MAKRISIFIAALCLIYVSIAASEQSVRPNAAESAGRTFTADRRYYAMASGSLEKWDFNRDGTFLHEGGRALVGGGARGSQRGTYRMSGNTIQLQISTTANAFVTNSPGGHGAAGGSSHTVAQMRRMNLQLIGSDGQDGIVLDGTRFNVRHWR